MENENLFIWDTETKKCWFGTITQHEEKEEGTTLVTVSITKGKLYPGTFHEMHMAREYDITKDSIGFWDS